MKLIPKNWHVFQHYKDRCPPWIKLHRDLLNDREFMRLPVASKALAPLLWLLASEDKSGIFVADIEELEFRLRMPTADIKAGLKCLIEKGFFVDASTMLAPCLQDATPETEGEGETEAEAEKREKRAPPVKPKKSPQKTLPENFEINEAGVKYANERGVNILTELQSFKDWHRSKGNRFVDWQAAWRTWCNKAVEFKVKQFQKNNPEVMANFNDYDYGKSGAL